MKIENKDLSTFFISFNTLKKQLKNNKNKKIYIFCWAQHNLYLLIYITLDDVL